MGWCAVLPVGLDLPASIIRVKLLESLYAIVSSMPCSDKSVEYPMGNHGRTGLVRTTLYHLHVMVFVCVSITTLWWNLTRLMRENRSHAHLLGGAADLICSCCSGPAALALQICSSSIVMKVSLADMSVLFFTCSV